MCSDSSADLNNGTRFQLITTQITPANESAFRKKTEPAPPCTPLKPATISPPSAGPTARARLLLAAFSETVSGISSRGTSSGTIACHAGLFIAEPILSRKVNASNAHGDTWPKKVRMARIPTEHSIHACQKISSLRRSKMSAVAPASSPSSSTGRLAAVCISAISKGDAVNAVISHVPAVSCIHVPTDEIVLAIHRSRNSAIFNGANPLGFGAGVVGVGALGGVSKGMGLPLVYDVGKI